MSGSVLVRPESCGGSTRELQLRRVWLMPQGAARDGTGGRGPAHLGSCPVNPAFAIGVNVHEDQSFDQVGEDELQ